MGIPAYLVLFAAVTALSACDKPLLSQTPISPISPTPIVSPAPPISSTPTIVGPSGGALAITSFFVTFNPTGWGQLRADYTLKETVGEGGVTLESLVFESNGIKDLLDAWCWGDPGIRIGPLESLDGKSLGYCQPSILTQSPGQSASLTAVYRRIDGTRDSVTVSSVIRRP